DRRADRLDPEVIPLTWTKCLTSRRAIAQVLKPAAPLLIVDATRPAPWSRSGGDRIALRIEVGGLLRIGFRGGVDLHLVTVHPAVLEIRPTFAPDLHPAVE